MRRPRRRKLLERPQHKPALGGRDIARREGEHERCRARESTVVHDASEAPPADRSAVDARIVPRTLGSSAGVGQIVGSVSDSSGLAAVDVEVSVSALSRTVRTDPAGRFVFTEVPSGAQQIWVRGLGWRPTVAAVTVVAGDTARVRIVMERMTILAPVVTRAMAFRMREFEDNRRLGLGRFVTQDDIERRKPVATGQLLLRNDRADRPGKRHPCIHSH